MVAADKFPLAFLKEVVYNRTKPSFKNQVKRCSRKERSDLHDVYRRHGRGGALLPQAEEKQGPAEKTPGPGPAPLHPGGGDLLRRQPRGLRPVRPGGFGVAAAHLREDPPAPDLRRPLRGHHGAAVHRVHPVPRVGAEPGQGGVPLPGPLHHLPAHRRDLHPHHPGVPGGLEGLDPVRGGVGSRRAGGGPQRRQRGALPEVLHGLLPGHGLGGGAGHGGFLPGGAGRGGLLYTLGAVLYGLGKKFPYVHSVFHLFVLAGSVCHTVSVWQILL